MKKKDIRDQIAITILKVAMGRYVHKDTRSVVTLFEFREGNTFQECCKLMKEHGISRRSIYTTIDMMIPPSFREKTESVKLLHDFCYTFLPKD